MSVFILWWTCAVGRTLKSSYTHAHAHTHTCAHIHIHKRNEELKAEWKTFFLYWSLNSTWHGKETVSVRATWTKQQPLPTHRPHNTTQWLSEWVPREQQHWHQVGTSPTLAIYIITICNRHRLFRFVHNRRDSFQKRTRSWRLLPCYKSTSPSLYLTFGGCTSIEWWKILNRFLQSTMHKE